MDFDLTERQMVRALRGERSQVALSHQLGYGFNQLSKWELGHKRVLWPDFVRVCDVLGVGLGEVLGQFFKYVGPTGDYAALITKICGPLKVSEIATQSGLSRFSLSRWLKGESSPSVADILQVMRCYRGGEAHIIAFVASLVDIAAIPELAAKHDLRMQRIALGYAYPWVMGASECFSLQEYRALPLHEDGFLGRKLGVPLDEEREVLAKLVELQVIESVDGKFLPFKDKLLFQENVLQEQSDIDGNIRIRDYWVEQALRFLRSNPDWRTMRFSWLAFAVSKPTFRAMLDASIEYYKRLGALIEADEGPKEIFQVMNLHFFQPKGTSDSNAGEP